MARRILRGGKMIYLNGQPLSVTIFPDNTSQVWKLPETVFEAKFAYIKWEFSHEGEFMHLAQLKDLLDRNYVPAWLYIKYLPYGRQDKQVSNEATFALCTFARLLSYLNFKSITIVDPHSDVIFNYLTEARAEYPIDKVQKVIAETGADLICYPDKGALAKYVKEYEEINLPYIFGQKVRDQLTGNITAYSLIGDCYGKNVLIVDDICDGGMTFKILAKDLLASGAKSVVLFVTHGIFSKGVRTLLESGINRVFTQDGEMSARSGSFHI
jgi:ribose-phosphate pyrophosphokinase